MVHEQYPLTRAASPSSSITQGGHLYLLTHAELSCFKARAGKKAKGGGRDFEIYMQTNIDAYGLCVQPERCSVADISTTGQNGERKSWFELFCVWLHKHGRRRARAEERKKKKSSRPTLTHKHTAQNEIYSQYRLTALSNFRLQQ